MGITAPVPLYTYILGSGPAQVQMVMVLPAILDGC